MEPQEDVSLTSVFSGERNQLKQPSECGLYTLKFVGRQRSQFSFQTGQGNGLDLLQMKHTRPQEWLGNSQFPTITSYSSGVWDDNDKRKFIVSRRLAENEARSDLGG
jgi:hypothetical protein